MSWQGVPEFGVPEYGAPEYGIPSDDGSADTGLPGWLKSRSRIGRLYGLCRARWRLLPVAASLAMFASVFFAKIPEVSSTGT